VLTVSTDHFADRLIASMRGKQSRLVVGIDPDLARIRRIAEFASVPVEDALVGFSTGILEACAEHVCATKPQIAFFEAHGAEGWAALKTIIARARSLDLPVILDAKRGDIGSTATAYASHLDPDGPLGGVDALTVNPYLGGDSMEPFLSACDRWGSGLFVLVKTSNPGASELQDLRLADGRRVCEAVADSVTAWGASRIGQEGRSCVGAVVGATHPEDVAHLRTVLPHAILLLPGVGAQGADIGQLRPAFGADGLGAVVNASREILYAWEKEPDAASYRDAARRRASELRMSIASTLP
jgi:orotidine-5'-phosphate decarboxylase